MKPWTSLDKLLWKVMVPLASLAVKPLTFLGITPNQLTLFNFLIFIPLSTLSFAQGNFLGNIFGIFFVLVYSYFDHVDGLLARATGKSSKFGAWFDQRLDIISSGIIMAGVVFSVYRNGDDTFFLAVGILALLSQIGILSIVFEYEKNIYHRPEVLNKIYSNKKLSLLDRIFTEFIFLKSFAFLFFGTFRYFLFLTAILNQLRIFLLFWAIFNNLRWIIMLWVYASAYSAQKSRFSIINTLQKFLNDV